MHESDLLGSIDMRDCDGSGAGMPRNSGRVLIALDESGQALGCDGDRFEARQGQQFLTRQKRCPSSEKRLPSCQNATAHESLVRLSVVQLPGGGLEGTTGVAGYRRPGGAVSGLVRRVTPDGIAAGPRCLLIGGMRARQVARGPACAGPILTCRSRRTKRRREPRRSGRAPVAEPRLKRRRE